MLGIFKSKKRKEQEREAKIRNAVFSFKRYVTKQQKHEKDYLAKAVRAKNAGDSANLKELTNLIKKTIRMRRFAESMILKFETMLQSRDQIRISSEFAKGMEAMAKSVNVLSREIDSNQMTADVDVILRQSENIEASMEDLFEQMSSVGDNMDGDSDGFSTNVEAMINNLADSASVNNINIDSKLREIEAELAGKQTG